MSKVFEIIDNIDKYIEDTFKRGKVSLKFGKNWRIKFMYFKRGDMKLFLMDIQKLFIIHDEHVSKRTIRDLGSNAPLPVLLLQPRFKGKKVQSIKVWTYRKLNELRKENAVFKTSFGWLCIDIDKCIDMLTEFQEKLNELKLTYEEAEIEILEACISLKSLINIISHNYD